MSAVLRYPLILNPRARSERAQRARRFVMENATRFAIYATNTAQESAELARRFSEEGEEVVVAAGGDGTLNAVVRGLIGTETVLGILPTGTMNVFARELNIPFGHLAGALEVIDGGHVKEVDLFEAEGTPFVQMAGVGFDAQVIEETTTESKRLLGPLAYILSAVRVLGSEPPRMKVHFDEGFTVEGACVLLGNGALYGGQLRLFGKADNADDLLDVLVYKPCDFEANRVLKVKPFIKPSSRAVPMHPSSCNPRGTWNWPVTEIRRYANNSSERSHYHEAKKHLLSRLVRAHWPVDLLHKFARYE